MEYLSINTLAPKCDFFYPRFHSGNPGIPHLYPNDMFDGCTVFFVFNYFKEFIEKELPAINKKFTVITACSDFIFPYMDNREDWTGYKEFLDNPYLLQVFAINSDIFHPKVRSIFVGLTQSKPLTQIEAILDHKPADDFMIWTCNAWGKEWVLGHFNNYPVKGILERMRAKKNSDKLLYVSYSSCSSDTCHQKENTGIRRRLDEYLKTTSFVKEPLVEFFTYLETLKQYKFTIEPPGRCIDGYRMFEALSLGTIPIFFQSSIDHLRKDLPVLIIKDFSELTPENLEKEYERIISRNDYRFELLTIDYWWSCIKAVNL